MELRGLITDILSSLSPNLSWRDAQNILITKGFNSISNENGFLKIYTPDSNSTIIGVISIPDGFVLFSKVGTFSEIGVYRQSTGYVKVLKTQYLNYNVNNPIEGVFKYNYKGELIICWTDNLNQLGLLNLDNLPFQVDVNNELINPSEIVKSYLFPEFKHCSFNDIEEFDGGGYLPEGVIYVSVRYEITDFDFTGCTLLSNPIPIKQTAYFGPNNGIGQFDITTGRSASTSYQSNGVSSSFKISITDLDTRYSKFQIILLSKTHNGLKAKVYQKHETPNTGNLDIIITSFTGDDINVDDVLNPRLTFKTCKTITTIDSRLITANIKYNSFPSYQKYANNIKVKYEIENLSEGEPSFDKENPKFYYSNSKTCFKFKTYQPNEVYAFYIHLIMKDGTTTDGYHIPGREEEGTDTEVVNAINGYNYEIPIDPEGSASGVYKRFHVKDTSIPTIPNLEGRMGYWENTDEFYPNTSDFEVWDNTGNIGSIQNQKVRHHRFPSAETIYDSLPDEEYRKVLCVSFDDIYIPNDIEDLIQGYYITYARRDSGKTLVQGESKILSGGTTTGTTIEELVNWYYFNPYVDPNPSLSILRNSYVFRFYDFNLLWNKPSITPRYLNNIGFLDVTIPSSGNFSIYRNRPTNTTKYQVVTNTRYYPIDNLAVSNYHKEETIGVEVEFVAAWALLQFSNSPVWNLTTYPKGMHYGTRSWVCQLMNHVYNVYNNFTEQSLVYTGRIFYTNGSNNYSISKLYGGDTFLNMQSFRTAYVANVDDTNTNTSADIEVGFDHHSGVFSPLNYNFIYGEEGRGNFEYYNTLATEYKIINQGDPTGEKDFIFRPVKYNNIFSSLNNLVGMFPYNTLIPFVDSAPCTIRRSVVFQSEDKTINWRDFLVNDYYEMERNKGDIWKVANLNRTLIIHQKYSLFTASIKDKLISSDSGDTFLGVGDIFDRQPIEQLTSDKGTVGTQSQFSSFVCDFGYISVDVQEGKVFIFDGTSPKEISNNRIRNKIRRLLTGISTDNPFFTGGVTSSYDDKNKRLILSFFNIQDGVNIGTTLSYSFDNNFWVSRHSYIPNHLFYNRDNIFAIKNFATKGVYSFNHTNKCIFFGEEPYPSSIDIIVREEEEFLESLFWRTLVRDSNNNVIQKETFEKIIVYNNLQSTSFDNIEDNSSGVWFKGNSRELDELWLYNSLRDSVINRSVWVHDDEGTVNLSNINSSKAWFKKSAIISNFVVVKLLYSNSSQYDIFLNEIGSNFGAKNR